MGSSGTLLNALFVSGTREDAAAIRQMPGVQRVVKQRYYKRQDIKAAEAVRAIFAWDAVGGESNAGAGIKIAVLDSGIDVNHPSLKDTSLEMPGFFPKCEAEYCDAYTSTKVIAARSFIRTQAVLDDPLASRPDDYSPRDRVGHGTAVASIAAGVRTDGPAGTLQGVAPKAYLGNYKIFGSPGVNDVVSDQTLIEALEAAYDDGMDIATVSVGAAALWDPDDYDGKCGTDYVGPCDLQAAVVENAVQAGMTVVVNAGNTAETGLTPPSFGTINTPGTSRSAITAGGLTNSHRYLASVRAKGDDVPEGLVQIDAQLSNGLRPPAPLTARIVDVGTLQESKQACTELPEHSLDGAIALIQRGGCEFVLKLGFAQKAGAIAVVFYQFDGSEVLLPVSSVQEAGIPAVMIGNSKGNELKNWIAGHEPDASVQIDPTLRELDTTDSANHVAPFSSRGPILGTGFDIKPDLAAVASGLYLATQTYDPNGDMYSPDGYTTAQGTSFAAPQVAGAVALLLQKYPRMTPDDLKSAVVNTANGDPTNSDGEKARVLAVGAGRLDVENALRTTVTAYPSSLSFGIPDSQGYIDIPLLFRNWGTSTVSLTLQVQATDGDARARVALNTTSVSIPAGGTARVAATVTGNFPNPGSYEGFIVVSGGGTTLRIPYLYMMFDDIPANLIPLTGDGFVTEPGSRVDFNVLSVDRAGVSTYETPVAWEAGDGAKINVPEFYKQTDIYGIGFAAGTTGDQLGYQEFTVRIGSGASALSYVFTGRNRARPTIAEGGVTSAIGGAGSIAAGSLVRITGMALAEASQSRSTPYFPLSLSNVSVSFDDEGNKTSYPGRVVSVTPNEVIVQAPWEIEGLENIQLKVSIGYGSQSDLVTVPVSRFAAAFYERNGFAVATDAEGIAVDSTHGVAPGGELNLELSGLGPVNNRPASGDPAPNRESTTHAVPEVTIAGQRAAVTFTGLKPGAPGVYLVSVTVPEGVGSGEQTVGLTVDGIAAPDTRTVIR